MKALWIGGAERERRFTIAFDSGDEIKSSLESFAGSLPGTGHLSGVGAVREATVAYWDADARQYRNVDIREQAEVLALTGNIATANGTLKLHAHIALGLRDGRAVGGHLVRAIVHPTLEVLFVESATALRREKDSATGLDLLSF